MSQALSDDEKRRLVELKRALEEKDKYNQLFRWEPYPWQEKLANSTADNNQCLAMCANRVGKALADYEQVLTPAGFVRIDSISEGDVVLTPNGGRSVVTGVFPQGVRQVYRITFNDGTTIDADGDHIWRCKTGPARFSKDRPCYGRWSDKTTSQIAQHGFKPRNRHSIPIVHDLSYDDQYFKVPPYLLGLLLGDGHFGGSINITTEDQEIVDYCKAVAPQFKTTLKQRDELSWCFSSAEKTSQGYSINHLKNALTELGLEGVRSGNKFIPSEYIHSKDRLEVLQGLMDSDGYCGGANSEFVSKSRALADGVASICRSLGIRCTVKTKKASCQYKGEKKESTVYRVAIWTTDIPLFKLERKLAEQYFGAQKNGAENVITNIEPLGETECTCIAIDCPEQLFITTDYIVTHNTFTGARITAFHLTGLYPDWWEGHRFDKPIKAWAAGASTVTTRDLLQAELLGDPMDVAHRGMGSIPKEHIVSVVRKPQIPNAVESITVKHFTNGVHDGNSVLAFKSYEMGEEKFMGASLDWIWLDEQPAQNIYTQCLTRTLDKKGFVMMTFTPESGMTPVIKQFLHDRKPGQFLIQATWDDAPHLDEEAKEQILAQYLPNEREMRTKGIPVFGKGMVFPYSLEDMLVDDFDIPGHWPRIAGIDFGFDHPTAIAWLAINPESNIVYLHDEYKESRLTPTLHAAAIKSRSTQPPIAWPHDGNRSFDGGDSLAQQYRQEGVNLLPEHFTNPPDISQSRGDNKISAGIAALSQAMEKGQFKVFKSCFRWQQEYGTYHFGDEGKIVDKDDDLMSATRYAFQSQRFAQVPKSAFSRKFRTDKRDYSWAV